MPKRAAAPSGFATCFLLLLLADPLDMEDRLVLLQGIGLFTMQVNPKADGYTFSIHKKTVENRSKDIFTEEMTREADVERTKRYGEKRVG